MKLSIVFLMLAFMNVSAASFAQKVNINVRNAGIDEVFHNLTEQTGKTFIADAALTKKLKPINLNMNKASLNEVLIKCFEGLKIKITVNEEDKIVVINEYRDQQLVAKQALTITGTVTDERNTPIPGVTIKLKNTQTASVTKMDGTYRIIVPDENSVLIFSSIGYTTQEVPVLKNRTIDIILKEQNTGLNEIIVVAYGQTKKRDLTGAVGQVKIDELQKAPVSSFDNALAGRVSGVVVSSNDGVPGGLNNIVIRGGNSVTQDNSPLYVVDGFPLENADFNTINPADIQSIDVLKDASSTAIYGARGANGVIIITTKRGVKGEPQINYNGYAGIQAITKKIAMLSPYEFVKTQLDYSYAIGAADYTPGDLPITDPGYVAGGRTLDSYKNDKGINWQDLIFRTAFMQNHDFSLRAGNDKTKYSLSGNILNQDGVFLKTGFGRDQGRFTIDQDVNSKLKISGNVNYSYTNAFGTTVGSTKSNGSNNLMYGIWAYRPVTGSSNINLQEDLFDPDMSIDNLSVNPLINAQNAYRSNKVNTLNANGFGEYAITKNLKLRISGGIVTSNTNSESFNNSKTTRGSIKNKDGVNGSVNSLLSSTWLNENTLNYNKVFSKGSVLDVLAGITSQANKTKSSGFSATQVPNEDEGISGLDESQSQVGNSEVTDWGLLSYLGRVNYSYKSKYLFTASFRADGSSRFAKGKRWGYFPSGAFAWRMSDEPFLKKITAISDAKIRVSYGITGNNRVDEYAYLSQLSLSDANAYPYNNVLYSGISLDQLGNPDLKWESTSQLNLGYDLSLFNDRLSLTVDWYRKTTYDLLLNAQVPYTTGVSQAFKNIGKMRNDGLEISINTVNFKNTHFSWTSNFNISFNNNKLLALTENQSTLLSQAKFTSNYDALFPYIAIIGQPVAQMYGLIWQGNYQYDDFNKLPNGTYALKDNIPSNGSVNVQPGDIKYKDINGDGKVDAKDYTVIGRALPIHTGGFSNQFNYNNFDLNIFFQWSYGNNIVNANRLLFESGGFSINQYASFQNRWSPTNPTNENFRVGGQGPYAFSSRVIEDGSYLRLKTVSLGYEVPKKYANKIGSKGIRVYASAQNLYTWTNYSGLDPEVSVRNSALTPGFDYGAYPRARTIIVGINVKL